MYVVLAGGHETVLIPGDKVRISYLPPKIEPSVLIWLFLVRRPLAWLMYRFVGPSFERALSLLSSALPLPPVFTTAGGVKFIVLKEGTGPVARDGDFCVVDFTG